MKQSLIKYPNGLRVVVSSRQSQVVTLSFSICFGAEQEKKDKSGITGIIEKLLFSSIKKGLSGTSCVIDSKTDYEHLEITISTIRENLEEAMALLTRAVFDFSPSYKDFISAKNRVIQAIEKSKFNPLAVLNALTQKTRFKTTSLATELLGTTKTITNLTLEETREYYYNILTPEYMLLSVVGNISDEIVDKQDESMSGEEVAQLVQSKPVKEEDIASWSALSYKEDITKVKVKKYDYDNLNYVKDLINREFYSKTLGLKKGAKRRSTAYFPLKEAKVIEKQKALNQSRFQIALPSAPYSSRGYKCSKLFEIMLRNYLTKSLTSEEGIYSLDTQIHQFRNNAYIAITFAVDYEKAQETYKKIKKLLKELKAQGSSKAEFNSLKTAYSTIISLGHERMSDLAKRYNKWLFLKGELFNLTTELKAIEAMNYSDYETIFKKMLDEKGMTVVYLGKKLDEDLTIN